jgi:hypothetical protein
VSSHCSIKFWLSVRPYVSLKTYGLALLDLCDLHYSGNRFAVALRFVEVMKTLRETFAAHEELIQPMFRWRYDGQPAGNGWTAPHKLGAFGTDYIHRAGMMYSGPYDNRSTETMYYFTDDDTQLNQLDGNSLYAVIFPKGQLPPVKGFWSLTMYDPRHFFYANDLNRYSLRFVSRILCTGR